MDTTTEPHICISIAMSRSNLQLKPVLHGDTPPGRKCIINTQPHVLQVRRSLQQRQNELYYAHVPARSTRSEPDKPGPTH